MASAYSEIGDPVTVQGRLQGQKSRFRVLVQRCSGEAKKLRIRIDDDLNPGFWAEVTVDPDSIPDDDPVHAIDFRYA